METGQVPRRCAAYSWIWRALFAVALFGLGSCRSHPPGQIAIDRAEVFTRERLVNRRLQEQQWLEKKLEFTNLDTTFQGASDLREFRGIVAALKGQFDPLGGDLQEATLNSQIRDRRNQDALAALQQKTNLLRAEIDRVKAEQDLLKLQQNPGTDVPGSAAPAAAAPATTGSTTATSPSGGTPLDASTLADSWENLQKGTLPDAQDLRTSSAKLTSVEKLRDEMAYRNAVHAALREAELDDVHDIDGYTLRTLKFDISVIPHDERAEDIGMIGLTAEPDAVVFDDPSELDDVYRSWQQTVLQQIQLEAISLQRRYLQGLITDDDIIQSVAAKDHVREALHRLLTEPADSLDHGRRVQDPDRERRLKGALRALDTLQLNRQSRQLDPNTSMILCKIVEWRYSALHDKYFHFKDIPTDVVVDGQTLSLSDLWPSPEIVDQAERHSSPDTAREISKALDYRTRVLAAFTTELSRALANPTDPSAPLTRKQILDVREPDWKWRKAAAEEEEKRLRGDQHPVPAELSHQIRKDAEYLQNFVEAIYKLDNEFKPYVYTVEPKELAQNISDVAAAEKLSSLVLAVGAALPQSGVKADGYLKQLDRSQLRLQAILRRPLVVGFVGREDGEEDTHHASFGWALGPRFEIDRSRPKVHYHQAEAQHSVQATIALPGWLDRIKFKYRVMWHNPSAFWPQERMMAVQGKKAQERHLTVDLSRDYEAITIALLGLHEAREQWPTVLPAKPGDSRTASYLLTEGEEKAGLLIRGANLWRNPQVFVGGQKAETVAVLPDMGGLYATFDKVRVPAAADRGSARVDLTIVTSHGVTRLPQAVQILPKTEIKLSTPVELKSTYAVANGTFKMLAAEGLIPKTSRLGAHLRARDTARMTWCDVIIESVTPKTTEGGPTTLEFKLDPSQKPVAQPTRLMFDLAIQEEYGIAYHSIPSFAGVKGELVYFPDPDQAKLKVPSKALRVKMATEWSRDRSPVIAHCACSDLEFKTDPSVSLDLFKQAYPWITDEKTAFRIGFSIGSEEFIRVPLSPGALHLSGTKPGVIRILQSDLIGRSTGEGGSKEQRLFSLFHDVSDTLKAPKRFRVRIEHPTEKESVLEFDGELTIVRESSPALLNVPDEPLQVKKQTKQVPGNQSVITYSAGSPLEFKTDAGVSLDRFKNMHSWITVDKTLCDIEFTPVEKGAPVLVCLGPGVLQLSGTEPVAITIGEKNLTGCSTDPDTSEQRKLFELFAGLGDPSKGAKGFKVRIKQRTEPKNVIEVDGVLALTGERPSSKSP